MKLHTHILKVNTIQIHPSHGFTFIHSNLSTFFNLKDKTMLNMKSIFQKCLRNIHLKLKTDKINFKNIF